MVKEIVDESLGNHEKNSKTNDGQNPKRIWDWKQSSKFQSQIPTKKRKLSSTGAKGDEQLKYFCIECFEAALQQKSDEKYVQICRLDNTSIKRHKFRWHLPPKSESCRFVPSNSTELQRLRQKYDKTKPAQLIPEHPRSRAVQELIKTSVMEIQPLENNSTQLKHGTDTKDMPEQSNLFEKDDISELNVDNSSLAGTSASTVSKAEKMQSMLLNLVIVGQIMLVIQSHWKTLWKPLRA